MQEVSLPGPRQQQPESNKASAGQDCSSNDQERGRHAGGATSAENKIPDHQQQACASRERPRPHRPKCKQQQPHKEAQPASVVSIPAMPAASTFSTAMPPAPAISTNTTPLTSAVPRTLRIVPSGPIRRMPEAWAT